MVGFVRFIGAISPRCCRRLVESWRKSKQTDMGVARCATLCQWISKQLCHLTSTPIEKSVHASFMLTLSSSLYFSESLDQRRRKQIESGGHEIFFCAPPTFLQCPQLEGHCSHQGGHKYVQSYCWCVKNWSVDNSVQLWINYINYYYLKFNVKVCQNIESNKNCSSYKVNDLSVCWNDSFRKIFGFNRWEPVTELSAFVMSYLLNVYDLCKWNFLNISNNIGTVALFIDMHNAIDALN